MAAQSVKCRSVGIGNPATVIQRLIFIFQNGSESGKRQGKEEETNLRNNRSTVMCEIYQRSRIACNGDNVVRVHDEFSVRIDQEDLPEVEGQQVESSKAILIQTAAG